MKIALVSFLFMISVADLLGQEFTGPTEADLLAVSLNLMDQSKKIMSSNPNTDCDEKMSKEITKTKTPDKGEIHCICEVGDSANEFFFKSFIGEYKGSEIKLITGNDNFFHGALQRNPLTKDFDGDDRGRTFGGGVDYTLYGKDGLLSVNLDSTGFGKFSTVGDQRRTSTGEYYLNFREVNTLKLSADKYLSLNEAQKTFVTGQFKFTNETDAGNFSRSVQQGWHQLTKDMMDDNIIQYKYLKEEEDINTLTLMGGVGKEWYQNLGNWKCDSGIQLQTGMSVNGSKKTHIELAAKAENRISHKALPWVALSTWIQGSNGFQGPTLEGGVVLSFEKEMKNVVIKPFIGIERHRSPMDEKFGITGGNPFENYHVLGVTIKY